MIVFGQNLLYSCKSGCIQTKVVVFRQIMFYSVKVDLFGKNGCILAKWLYSSKMVVLKQSCLYSGKSGCIREKWLFSGRNGCIRAKVVVLG